MAHRPIPITDCSCKYGAPMGRRSDLATDGDPIKLCLRHVPFIDGCYDQGGAYWGSPENLWVAWGDDGDEVCVLYVRARDRQDAKAQVIAHRHNARFYR